MALRPLDFSCRQDLCAIDSVTSGHTCTSNTWIESQQPLIFLEPSPTEKEVQQPQYQSAAPTLLDENNPSKAMVQIPEINTRDTPLVVELAVRVESLIGLDFQLTEAWRWRGSILKGRLVGV